MPAATDQRAAGAARCVAAVPDNPLVLVTFARAQKEVADTLGVTESTARRYLKAAVESGLLHQVKPRRDWTITHAIPGYLEWPTFDLSVYVDGNVGRYWLTTAKQHGRSPAVSLSFLVPPEQLSEIARIYKAEAEAVAAKEQQEQQAKEDADRAEALRRDPELVELLDRLAPLLPNSDVRALPVGRRGAAVPSMIVSRRDTEAFKAVLRRALGEKEN